MDRSRIIVTGKLSKTLKDDCVMALGIGTMGATLDVRGQAAVHIAATTATRR